MGIPKNIKGWSPLIVLIFILPICMIAPSNFELTRVALKCHYFRLKIDKISLQRSKSMCYRFNCATEAQLKWYKLWIHTFVEIGGLNRDFTVFWQWKFLVRLVPKGAIYFKSTPWGDHGAIFFCFNNVWTFQKT